MFSKPQTKGSAAPNETTAPRKLTVASLVAEGVVFRGDLATDGDLHLDGTVEGDLKAGCLTIGQTGVVSGAVQAQSIDVRGRVSGTICARQVRLWASARVEGDISHAELSVETGAHFEGRSLVLIPAEGTPALSVVAAE
ncbi:MAG TPA: polymer-forming cytoskeletal protein [Phenylobacterium sp.]|nr:polymer-forming cytoskeletal protein [Phenylobacterium sp.]